MRAAVEIEREPQLLEISEEVLSRHGWQYYERTDGHVFRIFIRQGVNLERVLTNCNCSGICARHQMKDSRGKLLPDSHMDFLQRTKIQEAEIMVTAYHPSVGHPSLTVLERTTGK